MLKQFFEQSVNVSDVPLILVSNPLNEDSETFIIPKKTGYRKAVDFIDTIFAVKDFEGFYQKSVASEAFINGLDNPSCTLHVDGSYKEILINLRTSWIDQIINKFIFIGHSKEFKEQLDYYVFLHELAHSSTNQRKRLYDRQEREFHSDFFAVFIALNEFAEESKKKSFLKGFLNHRLKENISGKINYSQDYSKFIYYFFMKNMNKINFEYYIENPDKLDDVIDNIVVDMINKSEELAEYNLLKYLEVKNES